MKRACSLATASRAPLATSEGPTITCGWRCSKVHSILVPDAITSDIATDPRSIPVDKLRGVGPARAKRLKELGLQHLGDLLEYFPRAYQTESPERPVNELVADEIQSARGEIVAVNYIAARPRSRFEATLDDKGEKLAL